MRQRGPTKPQQPAQFVARRGFGGNAQQALNESQIAPRQRLRREAHKLVECISFASEENEGEGFVRLPHAVVISHSAGTTLAKGCGVVVGQIGQRSPSHHQVQGFSSQQTLLAQSAHQLVKISLRRQARHLEGFERTTVTEGSQQTAVAQQQAHLVVLRAPLLKALDKALDQKLLDDLQPLAALGAGRRQREVLGRRRVPLGHRRTHDVDSQGE